MSRQPVLDVRELAALDVALHGPAFIVTEFVLGVGLAAGLSARSAWLYAHDAQHSVVDLVVSLALAGIAANYLPLMAYAIRFSRRGDAATVVASRLAEIRATRRAGAAYMARTLFLLIPFYALAAAILQAGARA